MNTDAAAGEENISDLEESNAADQVNESELSTDSQSTETNKETQLTNTADKPEDTKPGTDNISTEDKKENPGPSTENKPADQNPTTDAKPDKEEVMDPLKAKAKEWWETGANFVQSFWK
ncbi:hypothetical protein CONCODRAFT_12437 [Conidiobolus coronatus NRRL 28638]|uniref:Uncharacterized protein n=1 Tax=Conidiobolus coronatus (strain ATCC 28846 / CBS 209.66 / NRRL 28638) TaxID=796925 RepID=A0A137NT24_CONC2|nr:hypothetical protein CONCODRAFT_12437 [Conidiobolus coronatus NRRL 28638]|eukprot:KXN65858.1 hypothetical protein CONCODRAFT_12437 [Conidiobolus coronatus NRRL 28638]